MPTRRLKQEPLPEVTEEAQVDAAIERQETRSLGFDRHYPQWTANFRAAIGDWTIHFQVSDGMVNAPDGEDLTALEALIGRLEDYGFEACNSPDHPHAKSSANTDNHQASSPSTQRSTYRGSNTRNTVPADGAWRDDPATEPQREQLRKMKSRRASDRSLTKGEASDLLAEYFDR